MQATYHYKKQTENNPQSSNMNMVHVVFIVILSVLNMGLKVGSKSFSMI